MPPKRKSHQIEKAPAVILQTCSECRLWCASWSVDYLCKGGVKYDGGRHAHRIWDCYHQDYESDLESDEDGDDKPEPTAIRPEYHGCTMDQRVAFLSCVYKMAGKSDDFSSLANPVFLQQHFKELICDEKVIRFAVLYSCNKISPECHALPRHHGVAEIENRVGELAVFQGYGDDDDDDSDNVGWGECPCAVASIDADEAEHFVLTREQWKKLRNEYGCVGCTLYLSVLTFRNRDIIDVKSDILESIEIC